MTYKEKEQLSKKISLIIANALESNKITLKTAGMLAQACIKHLDAANSMEEFKTAMENQPDRTLTSLIYEIF